MIKINKTQVFFNQNQLLFCNGNVIILYQNLMLKRRHKKYAKLQLFFFNTMLIPEILTFRETI